MKKNVICIILTLRKKFQFSIQLKKMCLEIETPKIYQQTFYEFLKQNNEYIQTITYIYNIELKSD